MLTNDLKLTRFYDINAVMLTEAKYLVAISGAVQHYGRIQNCIVKNGRISGNL